MQVVSRSCERLQDDSQEGNGDLSSHLCGSHNQKNFISVIQPEVTELAKCISKQISPQSLPEGM